LSPETIGSAKDLNKTFGLSLNFIIGGRSTVGSQELALHSQDLAIHGSQS